MAGVGGGGDADVPGLHADVEKLLADVAVTS